MSLRIHHFLDIAHEKFDVSIPDALTVHLQGAFCLVLTFEKHESLTAGPAVFLNDNFDAVWDLFELVEKIGDFMLSGVVRQPSAP